MWSPPSRYEDIEKVFFPENSKQKVYGFYVAMVFGVPPIVGILFCLGVSTSTLFSIPIIVPFALTIWHFISKWVLRLWYWLFPPKNLLVLIANFEPVPGDDKDAKSHGETVPAELERMIIQKKEWGVPLEYPIRHGQEIEGKTEEEKRKNAREIGLQKGAHLVLWGNVQFTQIGGKGEFYLEPKITIVQPLGPTELEERQPGEMRVSLSNPEILELRRRKIEETADIVSFIHGLAFYNQQKYEDAINIFKGIKNPDAEVYFYYGTALMSLRCFKEALEKFDEAIKLEPENAPTRSNLGTALIVLAKYDEAIACFERAIGIDPRYAIAWNNKGIALDRLNKHKEAISCYDKAIEIKPQYAEAWYNKGIILYNSGKSEEAIACYNEAIKINRKFLLAWNNKGAALSDLENYKEAIRCYNKAIKINKEYADAWYNKGKALIELRKYKKALKCFKKAIKINPRFVEAWSNMGGVLVTLGKHEEAINCCDEAIEINKQYAPSYCNKGNALDILRRFPEAIEAYQNFIRFATPQDAALVQKAKKRIRELEEKIKQK